MKDYEVMVWVIWNL